MLISNFDAQYGNFSGGQVLVTTKSGTNQFHGSAFEFLRNTTLDARNYFSQRPRPATTRTSTGATLGGPIRKNKALLLCRLPGHWPDAGQETGLHRGAIAGRSQPAISPTSPPAYRQVNGNIWANDLSRRNSGTGSTLASPTTRRLHQHRAVRFSEREDSAARVVDAGKTLLQYIPHAELGHELVLHSQRTNETLARQQRRRPPRRQHALRHAVRLLLHRPVFDGQSVSHRAGRAPTFRASTPSTQGPSAIVQPRLHPHLRREHGERAALQLSCAIANTRSGSRLAA